MAWGAIAGAVLGGVSSVIGGSSKNEQARKQAAAQNKYQSEVYKYQWQETKAGYKYQKDALKIKKANDAKNIAYQEAVAQQQWDYGMAVQAYEFNQAKKAYDASVAGAFQQIEYNQLAEKFAYLDQERLLHEQMMDLAFDRTQTLLEYQQASSGLGLKQRQAKASAVVEAQTARIAAAKEQGVAAASGVAGRSAAKNIQGIVAEAGARQAAIVEDLMFNQENTALEFVSLNNQFLIDQVALDFSEQSAKLSDISAKNKIKAATLQAALDAANSIAMKPEMAPPLPKPIALPRPIYQDVYKPKKPPKPMKQVAAQTNLFAAGLSGALSGAQMGMSIQSGIKGLGKTNTPRKPGKSGLGGAVTLGPGQVSLGQTPQTLPGFGPVG